MIITKKCRHCGGNVAYFGTGVIIERCRACGKEHREMRMGPGKNKVENIENNKE